MAKMITTKTVTKEHYTKWATELDTQKKLQQSTHQPMLMSLETVEFIVKIIIIKKKHVSVCNKNTNTFRIYISTSTCN